VCRWRFWEAKIHAIDFADLEDTFQDYMRDNKYCRVVVYPNIGKVTIWTANPVASREEAKDEARSTPRDTATFATRKRRVCWNST